MNIKFHLKLLCTTMAVARLMIHSVFFLFLTHLQSRCKFLLSSSMLLISSGNVNFEAFQKLINNLLDCIINFVCLTTFRYSKELAYQMFPEVFLFPRSSWKNNQINQFPLWFLPFSRQATRIWFAIATNRWEWYCTTNDCAKEPKPISAFRWAADVTNIGCHTSIIIAHQFIYGWANANIWRWNAARECTRHIIRRYRHMGHRYI